MKAKWLLLSILFLAISLPAAASTGWRSLIFEDLESIVPPALPSGWVTLNPALDQGVWQTQDFGGVKWGRNCARYSGDLVNPADDWIITSAVTLTAGASCTVKFMTRTTSPGNPFTLQIRAGLAQNPAAMTISLLNQPIVSSIYVQGTGNFIAATAGTYYIGFHVTGPPGVNRLYIDDVDVNVPETGLTLALGFSKALDQVPLVYSLGDTIQAVVRLKNVGAASTLMNKRFSVGAFPSDIELDFYVTGPDGLRVPCINMYAKLADITGSDFATLTPGNLLGKVINLRGWYGFYAPGAYTIQVHYRNHSIAGGAGSWLGELVSDPVAITVQ